MVDSAIDAMADWMRSGQGANHGGAFAAAQATDELTEAARTEVAALLGGEAVVFGPSMTALTMRFARTVVGPGDEVVCTRLDHDANVRPWVLTGANVRFATPNPDLSLSADAVLEQLTEKTRWVALTGASNAVGSVPAVDEIVAAVHDVGARVYLDAVHAVPHRRVDASAVDVLACSSYKWFGPHVGILCASRALFEEYSPDKLIPSRDGVPDRYELGTLPFESLAGVRAAAEYLRSLDWDAVRAHEDALLERALDGLGALDGVTLYGAAADRTPTVMFNVAGATALEVATALAAEEIAVWHGNYYAHELAEHLGLNPDGAVRAGFLHYNEAEEADRLVAAVARLTTR
jgi:cysteine desulfurase family protein (TIGR01976 family)